jgi:serine/threonine protein kinase
MKVNQETCDLRRLDLFLRGRLPQDFQGEVEAHLQVCPACRDKLDELAGGTRWWSAVRQHLGNDGAFALSQTSDETTPPKPKPTTPELDFLQPSPHPGSLGRIGIYEVLETIGQGGMGIVLRAFDPALHRPVAIKVLAAEFAIHGTARQRFAREARAAAAVVHDHVVPVHMVDADAMPPYLVMGFIPGRSLQQRIDASGPLELKEILRIGMQTASGLAAAHAQGLVHRDIKPANIMLENGVERVRITDFGLARAVDDASVTQSGALAGTPQYMAPEQARGEAIDQRADLFALGSTMYAMCTGHPPFRGSSSVAVLRLVCDTEPKPIRSINPDIPAWLEGIIRKLHAKAPEARFPSAAAVADLLERCLAHVQQPDRQPLPAEAEALGHMLTGKPARRVEYKWWAFQAACLLFCLGMLYYFWPAPIAPINSNTPNGPNAETPGPAMVMEPFADDKEWDCNMADLRSWANGLLTSPVDKWPEAGADQLYWVKWNLDTLFRRMQSMSIEPGPDLIQQGINDMQSRIKRLQHELSDPPQAPAAPRKK